MATTLASYDHLTVLRLTDTFQPKIPLWPAQGFGSRHVCNSEPGSRCEVAVNLPGDGTAKVVITCWPRTRVYLAE